MFIGVELVADRQRRVPMDKQAVSRILYAMKRRDVIINSEGPDHNVIKIKPPICFTRGNVDEVCHLYVCRFVLKIRPLEFFFARRCPPPPPAPQNPDKKTGLFTAVYFGTTPLTLS